MNEITYDYINNKLIKSKIKKITIIIIIVFYLSFVYKINYYYFGVCVVEDKACKTTVIQSDLNKLVNQEIIIIENRNYKFNIINIGEITPISYEVLTQTVDLKIENYKYLKNNNYIKFKIKIKEKSIFYLIVDYLKGG